MKPKPGKLDMEAIAKLLGVSKTTVHYAIRNTGRLSEHTRKRVLKMVEAKGYRPDGLARSFRRRRSDTLGVVLVTLTNSFHAHLLARHKERRSREMTRQGHSAESSLLEVLCQPEV